MNEDVFEMLVDDIVAKYAPVYPDGKDWQKTVEYFYKDEAEFMAELWGTLNAEGIREPIILSTDDDVEVEDPKNYYVLDGTHRVALALRHGLITLPARHGYETSDVYPLCLIANISTDVTKELTEEEDEKLVMALRSWKLDSNTWINSDVSGGFGSKWDFYLNASDVKLISKIEIRILEILRKEFPNYEFTVEVVLDTDED